MHRTSSHRTNVVLVALVSVVSLVACASESSDIGEVSSDLSTTCGNGVRETGEQCDDSNASSLDGCSATCQFEQTHRMNSLKMEYAPSSFCTANVIGKAIGSTAQGQLQGALDNAIKDGSISVLLAFGGLTDPTGQNVPSLKVGTMLGKPVANASYDGSHDLDWWYSTDASSLDASRSPLTSMDGSVANGALSAGPGSMTFALALGAGASVAISNARMKAKVEAASTPTLTSGSSPPGHLVSEHVDPALMTFASLASGEMCGNLSAASLAAMAVPAELADNCSDYTTENSILDVFVGGCKVFFFTVINKTQPDQVDPAAPAVGAGGPYTLKAGSDHKVSTCTDRTGGTVDLQKCIKAAAFSSAFQFTSDRVVVRN